jgi:hypothetical protein
MFDLLVVCGDSHSFGTECLGDHNNSPDNVDLAYGKHIANALNIKKYDNIAIPGASNLEIFDTTLNYIESYKGDLSKVLLIVGWSEPNRINFNFFGNTRRLSEYMIKRFLSNSPTLLQGVTDSQFLKQSLQSIPYISDFFRGMIAYIFNSDHFNYMNMLIRLSLDFYLRSTPVNYFTFPAMNDGLFLKYNQLRALFTKNNMFELTPHPSGSNFKDIKFNMMDWFGLYGIASGGHLKANGHKQLASFLIEEMRLRKIIP